MANGEFMRTSYDTEEENEPKPINVYNDNGPFEIPPLQVNGGGVASQNMVGKSSRPSRKRVSEDAASVLVQELKRGLKDINNAIDTNRRGKWLEK